MTPPDHGPRIETPRIDALLDHCSKSPHIERGVLDRDFAEATVDRIDDDYVLYAASKDDWAAAMTLSYSHACKAVLMLLHAHGWRVPDQPGKHARIAEAVEAWLEDEDPPYPRIASSFSRSRKARNNEEYPDNLAPLPDDKALRQLAFDNVRLLNRVRAELGRDMVVGAIPNENNLEAFRARP